MKADEQRLEAAKDFVCKLADGTPDEMELYADIASRFAAQEVREDRKAIADELEAALRSSANPSAANNQVRKCIDRPREGRKG